MYSTPTLLTILAFLALINIVIIISLYRVNRKRKQQNEKLISGWQLQNQYMDHNVEFCKRAGEITKQVRDAIEAFDSKEKEEDCLEECSQLLRYIHGGSTAQEALIADKKGKCEQLGIRFEDEIRALPDPAVMQEIDMISLMGNLLDNAIEACQASGQEKPYLRFSSMIRKKVWMVEVSNSKSSGLSPKKEGMNTTKEDTLNHGLGIGIISSIVSSYNGSLSMEDHGDYFETNAQLFLQKSSRRNRRKKKSVYA